MLMLGDQKVSPIEDAVIAFALRLVVLGARFGGDDVAHGCAPFGIPGGAHADGLREYGGIAGARDAVQGFIPCLVVGNAEARNGGGPVFKLVGFFIQGHAADQVVGALSRGELGVEIRLLLREDDSGGEGEGKRDKREQATGRHEGNPPEILCISQIHASFGDRKPHARTEKETAKNFTRPEGRLARFIGLLKRFLGRRFGGQSEVGPPARRKGTGGPILGAY